MVSIAEMEGRAREEDEETVGMEGWNRDEDEGDCVDQTVNKAINLGPSEVMAGQG